MTATMRPRGRSRDDRYPSRLADRSGIQPRQDPVVWGRGTEGPLRVDQVESYERDGYLQIPGLLSPEEVSALDDEIGRLVADPVVREAPETIIERGSDEVRSIFEVHNDRPFDSLVADPRLAGVARQLLGSDVYIHQSRINLKPGFRGREFYWHSDFETWHTEDGMPSMRAVSCSVSLTDNTHTNGPLMVIAGSHRSYVSCAGETPPNHHLDSLRKQEIGVPADEHLQELAEQGEIRDLVGSAGSVTFFECNLMHGSNGNITPHPRRNVFLVFNSMENTLEEPFAAPAPRPTHIASRRFDPLG